MSDSQFKDLKVTGRTSSFYFKDKNEDLRTVGKMLGVANILEGSVRKDGNQVRITAQLINAETGYHEWSKTYDLKLDDIFTVQDEIAKSVAQAIGVTLGVLTREPGMTRNVEAYEEYLKGVSLYLDFQGTSFEQGIEHFQRAVALDPSFSQAWLVLSGIYGNGVAFRPDRAEEWRRQSAVVHW